MFASSSQSLMTWPVVGAFVTNGGTGRRRLHFPWTAFHVVRLFPRRGFMPTSTAITSMMH
jgi:hypothetical protein